MPSIPLPFVICLLPERLTDTNIRNGTISLFAALDIATGAVIGKYYKRHRATEFLDFLKRIDAAMPMEPDMHLVMDGQLCHSQNAGDQGLAVAPSALACLFHTDSGSWINQVERWFAELTRKQLQRGVHRSTAELGADITAFIAAHNKNPKPYKWVKSAEEILPSVKTLLSENNAPNIGVRCLDDCGLLFSLTLVPKPLHAFGGTSATHREITNLRATTRRNIPKLISSFLLDMA